MRLTPDVNRQPPVENYSLYDISGVPYVGGHPGMVNKAEYQARTAPVVRVGIGNFDTAKPDEEHFGRTLNEILAKVATGEYRLLSTQAQWVHSAKLGVRVMQYVQWAEYSDRPITETLKAATRNTNFLKGR